MKVLIVDDEKPARQFINDLVGKNKEFEIIGEAANGFEALKLINDLQPELVFLDIQMPKINGFELLELLENPPHIIFTTAYSEFAIKAFELNAIDYLLKPIQEERLKIALEKALNSELTRPNSEKINEELYEKNHSLERIVVKTGSQIHILPIDEIDRIEADDDYVRIHSNNESHLKKMTMKFLEDRLPQNQFIRIHRSHILNISNLQKLEAMGKETHVAILKNGNKLPVSASGYQLLKNKLNF